MEYEIFKDIRVKDKKQGDVSIVGISFSYDVNEEENTKNAAIRVQNRFLGLNLRTKDGYKIEDTTIYDHRIYVAEDIDYLYKETASLIECGLPIFITKDRSTSLGIQGAFNEFSFFVEKNPVYIHLGATSDCKIADEENYYYKRSATRKLFDLNVDPRNIVLIGQRDFSDEEAEFLKENPKIDCFKASDLKKLGSTNLCEVLTVKYNKESLVYLSIDVNLIDPAYLKAVDKSIPFGLTPNETLDLIVDIIKHFNVGLIEITGLTLKDKEDDESIDIITSMLREIIYEHKKR